MHAGFGAVDFEEVAELGAEAFDQGGATGFVEGAHAADVAGEMAVVHEVGEGCLKQVGRKDIDGEANGGEAMHEVGGYNDGAEAERGAQDFAEGSNVDDAVAGVESLEGGDGHAVVAILGVVVVFDDPGGSLAGPLEKLKAARGGHGDAEGVMMRGRDEGHTRIGSHTHAGGDVEAIFIDGDGDGAAAGAEQQGANERIAGFFEPRGVAGVEENAGGDVECLLRAGDDHDLEGIAANGASGAQVGADGFAKGLEAERMEVAGGVDAQRAAMAGEQLRPNIEGEVVERRLMNAEGPPALAPRIGSG